MDASGLIRFLSALGCGRARVTASGWLRISCPLAPYRHKKQTDRDPSFFVKIAPGDRSVAKCQSCGFIGDLHTLLWLYERLSRTRVDSVLARAAVEGSRVALTRSLERVRRAAAHARTQSFDSWPREVAGFPVTPSFALRLADRGLPETYPEADLVPLEREVWARKAVQAYLLGPKRNLTPGTIREWRIGYHAPSGRVSVPIFDCEGHLVGVTGRAIDPSVRPSWMHPVGFQRDLFLFGEHRVTKGRRGILVEGFFDAIYLAQQGYANAVALMGTHLSAYQREKVTSLFSEVVLLFDGDQAGRTATQTAYRQLVSLMPVSCGRLPEGKDPDQLSAPDLALHLGSPSRV